MPTSEYIPIQRIGACLLPSTFRSIYLHAQYKHIPISTGVWTHLFVTYTYIIITFILIWAFESIHSPYVWYLHTYFHRRQNPSSRSAETDRSHTLGMWINMCLIGAHATTEYMCLIGEYSPAEYICVLSVHMQLQITYVSYRCTRTCRFPSYLPTYFHK